VRRVLPWALLLLIGVGTGLGALLGAANSPGTAGSAGSAVLTGSRAQRWLSGVLAATKAAGSAHLHYSLITTSPNQDLRGSGSGSGVVDFATRNFRVSETDHGIEVSSENGGPMRAQAETTTNAQIAIGRSVYENFGRPGFEDNWTKLSIPRDEAALGLASAGGFGGLLSVLTGPFSAVDVSDLGTTVVSGEPATRYLVQVQVAPKCPRSQHPRTPPGRASVWVDAQGRLVQVRMTSSFSAKLPASFVKSNPEIAGQPLGPITLTSTLRFSAFGAAVHIEAPNLAKSHGRTFMVGGGSSTGTAVSCG
jgi:hypothetical protein